MPLEVKVDGLDELKKKAEAEHLIGGPAYNFFHKVLEFIATRAMHRAPTRTGRLQRSARTKIDANPVPKFASLKMGTGIVGKTGGRYPFMLEASNKFHYAGTGQPTKHWFGGAVEQSQGDVEKARQDMAKDIEERWQR